MSSLAAKDTIQAVDRRGQIINTSVEKLFASRSRILSVRTDRGELRTTSEHPLGLADGTYLAAGLLQPGHRVLFRDKGALVAATVLGTAESTEAELVYNLSVKAAAYISGC